MWNETPWEDSSYPHDKSWKQEEFIAIDSKMTTNLLKTWEADLIKWMDATLIMGDKSEYVTNKMRESINNWISTINSKLKWVSYVKARIMWDNPNDKVVEIANEFNDAIKTAKDKYIEWWQKDADLLINSINSIVAKLSKTDKTITDNISENIAYYWKWG